MEAIQEWNRQDEWTHYCEVLKSKQFVLCTLNSFSDVGTRRFNTPYDSAYLFDTVQIKNVIYFSGGGTPSPELFYQSMMKITISPSMEIVADKLACMGTARANHTMVEVGEKAIYVIGGTNTSGNIASCEEYNIATNKWRDIASLSEKKKWVSVCPYKGRYLYAFNGAINTAEKAVDTVSCNTIERLDLADTSAKVWSVIKLASGKELWKSCCFAAVVPISETCIMVFGGIVHEATLDDCLGFNPTTNTIERKKNLLRPDAFYRTKYGMKGDKFAIVGSRNGDLHIFEKSKDKWDLMVKSIWNPVQGIVIKYDTF